LQYTSIMAGYWLARGGQKYGPYSIEDLRRMQIDGSAGATDMLWQEGMNAWTPFVQVVPQLPPVTPIAPPPPYSGQGSTGLAPPGDHWLLVLLLGGVTLGIFGWYWCFKESNFVRRLDPNNRSTLLLALTLITMAAYLVSYGAAVNADDADGKAIFLILALLFELSSAILFLLAIFKMRGSMLTYYNQVEPINLRLSRGMTFFFSILYLQHHFRRIAKWKETGVLRPQ